MKVIFGVGTIIYATLLYAALPALARAPHSGAEYFRLQQERVEQQMDSSIRPKANPTYPTIRPVRSPRYEN